MLAGIITLGYNLITGIPPFPSTQKETQALVKIIGKLRPNAKIYELGCGWGTILSTLRKTYPATQITGIEISPLPWFISWLRMLPYKNVSVRLGNFFKYPLNDADLITAYLMIKPMPKLAKKLDSELKKDSQVVTVAFLFKDRKPTKIIKRKGLLQADVALYKF